MKTIYKSIKKEGEGAMDWRVRTISTKSQKYVFNKRESNKIKIKTYLHENAETLQKIVPCAAAAPAGATKAFICVSFKNNGKY